LIILVLLGSGITSGIGVVVTGVFFHLAEGMPLCDFIVGA
jgi:hypothetical protein